MKRVLFKTLIFIILSILLSSMLAINASASTLSAEIVIEQKTGRILHQSNASVRLPMASTTKIMAALVAIENNDPDDIVIIPREAQGVEGSSIYLKAGENYTVRDLLYGLMLRSGNDSAVALAIYTAGTIENFCTLMNKKAKEIGANDTNFTNPHGLHDDNHYTTAKDLAMITRTAYENELFRKIARSKFYDLKKQRIYNKNKLLSSYEGADGVKTGYTTVAGRCLVSSSTKNGMQVICVTLNCYDMWERSKTLMTKAHDSFSMRKIVNRDQKFDIYPICAEKEVYYCAPNSDFYYPIKQEELSQITYKIKTNNLVAPIKKGQYCGKLEVYLDNCLIFQKNIYTIEEIKQKSLFDRIFGK